MRTIIDLLLLLVALFAVACSSNEIYYRAEDNTVQPCDVGQITRLTIKIGPPKGSYDLYIVTNINDPEISLNGFSNFDVQTSPELTAPKRFELRKNSHYVFINDTYPDATGGELEFDTDSFGKVVNASRTSCN